MNLIIVSVGKHETLCTKCPSMVSAGFGWLTEATASPANTIRGRDYTGMWEMESIIKNMSALGIPSRILSEDRSAPHPCRRPIFLARGTVVQNLLPESTCWLCHLLPAWHKASYWPFFALVCSSLKWGKVYSPQRIVNSLGLRRVSTHFLPALTMFLHLVYSI